MKNKNRELLLFQVTKILVETAKYWQVGFQRFVGQFIGKARPASSAEHYRENAGGKRGKHG